MPRTARNRIIFALPQPQSGLLLLLLQGEGDEEEEEEEKEEGAFGGAPYYRATSLVRGVPKYVWGGGMRAQPLGPSVELPMGPRAS